MNIILITQYYKPEMGAPQNRLYEMCSGLKKLGANVAIVTGMPNYPTGAIFKEYKGKFSKSEKLDDMPIKRYWLYASNSKKVLPRIFNMASFAFTSLFSLNFLRKQKPDIIIVESPPLLLGITAKILSKMTKSKLVVNVSDLWPLSAVELGAIREGSLPYKVLSKIEHYLYTKSACCIGQSQEIVDFMADHGAKQTYLFRNGVDPSRFSHDNVPKNEKGKLKIIYTGLLGFAQDILSICKNIDFSKHNSEFIIYGAGGQQEEIEDYIKNNPYKGIEYRAKVSREMIPQVLSECDCTLIPLTKRIFGAVPSKIYESMAAGLPIIFAGEGEGQKIVEENNIGWCCPSGDFKSMEGIIDEIEANPEILSTKSINCKNCASNKFNRPKQVKELYEFLESL